jgi:hypothetical protein
MSVAVHPACADIRQFCWYVCWYEIALGNEIPTLTDVKCRNAKGKFKPHKLSDGGGLHLLINADGAKYWRLAYRWHGKQRTLALGVYPAVGLTEARAARDDAKRSLASNVDPSQVKRDRKRAAEVATGNTF